MVVVDVDVVVVVVVDSSSRIDGGDGVVVYGGVEGSCAATSLCACML